MKPTHSDRVAAQVLAYPNVHRSTLEIVPYFDYLHLPEPLQEVSRDFHHLAHHLVKRADDGKMSGPEVTVALRKLLESKDAAVRSAL